MNKPTIINAADLSPELQKLHGITAGGASPTAIQIWNESEDDGKPACEYCAENNTVYINGPIADSDTPRFFIDIFGMVTPAMVKKALLQAPDDYQLHIHSPGGSVFACADIITEMNQRPPSKTIIGGIAASAGALIALVSPERQMGSQMSMMMFHPPVGGCIGSPTAMQETVDLLLKMQDTMLDHIQANVSKTAFAEISAAVKKDKDLFLTAKECVKLNIATDIANAKKDKTETDDDDKSIKKTKPAKNNFPANAAIALQQSAFRNDAKNRIKNMLN